MLDISSGSITIDGIDIRSVSHEHVRSSLVAVPQEAYIFEASVRKNIDPAETASDETIIDALRKVQLWLVIERRGGLDAIVDDIR